MRHPHPAILRIPALQQHPLPLLHPAPIPPLLPLRPRDRRRLPRACRVAVFDGRDGRVRDGGGGGEGEGVGGYGGGEGAPDVDDADALILGFRGGGGGRGRGEVQFDALCGGACGLVDVDARDGVARGRRVGAADGVVEDEDLLGARLGEEEAFDFRVVVGFDGLVVGVRREEGVPGDFGGDVLQGGEGVRVE